MDICRYGRVHLELGIGLLMQHREEFECRSKEPGGSLEVGVEYVLLKTCKHAHCSMTRILLCRMLPQYTITGPASRHAPYRG